MNLIRQEKIKSPPYVFSQLSTCLQSFLYASMIKKLFKHEGSYYENSNNLSNSDGKFVFILLSVIFSNFMVII